MCLRRRNDVKYFPFHKIIRYFFYAQLGKENCGVFHGSSTKSHQFVYLDIPNAMACELLRDMNDNTPFYMNEAE